MTDIKKMLSQYFEATISPNDMANLETLASQVASGVCNCPDESVKADMMLIYSLNRFAANSLSEVSASVPDTLEDRLSNHISMLAAESRKKYRKSFIRRLTTYSAAASVIAVMGIVGFNYLTHEETPSAPQILIADASLSEKADNPPAELFNSPATEVSSPAKVSSKTTAKSGNRKKAVTKTSANSKIARPTETSTEKEVFLAEANEALDPVPPFAKDAYIVSEEAFKVVPSGITAYVETNNILIQPLSTLSQSIYNIYESVEMVADALSAIPTAFDAVSSSLSLLSEPLASNDDF
ncbi:MAG: hypothetical protein HDR88_14845 [Bacteroides sp.]|nr:hypothetical protein [Bacteroides sp.]